jgi:hypothetical protein
VTPKLSSDEHITVYARHLRSNKGLFPCRKPHSPSYKFFWAINSLTINSRPSTKITDDSIGKSRESEGNVLLRGQLPKSWDFRGREDHLKNIAMHLDRGHQKPFEKSVLIISGLSGAGKSQLASAYVKSQLAEDSGREIFWINGRNRKTFETNIVQFCRDKNQSQVSTQTQVTEDTDRESAKIIESFLQELNRPGNTGWLMVVDDMTLWSHDGDSTEESADLGCYLNRIRHGSLLITTNRQNWLTSHENVLRVEGLDDKSAMSLLKSKLHNHSTRDTGLFSPQLTISS